MGPPSEQLIRDYLNRLSVAARGTLGSQERRALLARTHDAIERLTAAASAAPAQVAGMLAALGEPEALVDQERARLAAARGTSFPASFLRGAQPLPRPPGWAPRKPSRRPGQAHAAAAPQAPDPPSPAGRAQPEGDTAGKGPAGPADGRGPRPTAARSAADGPRTKRLLAMPGGWPGRPGSGHDDLRSGPRGGGRQPEDSAPPDAPAGGGWQQRNGAATAGPAGGGRQGQNGASAAGAAGSAGRRQNGAVTAGPAGAGRLQDSAPAGSAAAFLQRGRSRLVPALAGRARIAAALGRRHPLEAVAVVLLGLGGLIYPPLWLLGLVAALLSRVWDFRDKWAGLAGPVALVIVGTGTVVSLGPQRSSVFAYFREAWLIAGYLSRAGAVMGAAYLAWRLQHGRRQRPVPPWNRHHLG